MLPQSWVDRIFGRLQGIYGSQFTAKFSTGIGANGMDAGFENAKAVWADELAGFEDMPEAIGYALKNLDDKFPPSAREFLALCRHAPRKQTLALAHKLTPEEEARAAEFAEKIKKQSEKRPEFDHLMWAKRPGSQLAFANVLKVANKGDMRFKAIVAQLIDAGVTDGTRLLKRWESAYEGGQWVSV